MKKILIPILAIVILYCATWFGYAQYVKKVFTVSIVEAFNESGLGSFEYESVSLSGFPTKVVLNVNNPKKSLKSGEILEQSTQSSSNEGGESDFQWNDVLSRDGSLVIQSNLLSTEYKITMHGDVNYKSKINDEETNLSIKGEDTEVTVIFNKSPLLIKPQGEKDNSDVIKQIFDSIKKLELIQGKVGVHDGDTGDLLISSDGIHIIYDINKSGEKKNHEFIFKNKDAEFTGSYKDIVAKIVKAISPVKDEEIDSNSYDLSSLGKVNSNIHFIYDGALGRKDFMKQDGTVSLKVPMLMYSDDFSKIEIKSDLSLTSEKGELVAANINWEGGNTFTERWYKSILQNAQDLKQELLTDNPKEAIESLRALSSNPLTGRLGIKSDEKYIKKLVKLVDNAESLLPKLHELGAIKHSVDLSYDVKADKMLDINKLDILTDLNGVKEGIRISGDVVEVLPMPSGNISISLVKYSNLVDDIFAYVKQALPAIEDITGEKPPFEIQDGIEGAVKGLLVKLADSPQEASDDVTITIKSDEKSPMPMIGDMMIMRVAMLVQNALEPYIKFVEDAGDGGDDVSSNYTPKDTESTAVQKKNRAIIAYHKYIINFFNIKVVKVCSKGGKTVKIGTQVVNCNATSATYTAAISDFINNQKRTKSPYNQSLSVAVDGPASNVVGLIYIDAVDDYNITVTSNIDLNNDGDSGDEGETLKETISLK